MTNYSRRQFLKQIGVLFPVVLTAREVFSFSKTSEPFEILVVGDSLVWGQGLEERHKFYFLVSEWLRTEIFGNTRPVNLKIKAHSGAQIFLHDNEKQALKNAGKDEAQFYFPEVNLVFPSIQTQLEAARKEYERAESVDLIMLTGGITDIGVSHVINPFESNEKLKKDVSKYCGEDMFRLLDDATRVFPNALIVIVGYFPMVSSKSSTGKVFNAVLENYDFPGPLKPLANNIMTRQFLRLLHHKMNRRSRIWVEESNQAFQGVVNRLNDKAGRQRAIFVKSPITEDGAYGTKNTLLWQLGKNARPEDEIFEKRASECKPAIESLKDVRLKFRTRSCEVAGIGHPNIEGAKVYAESIKESLKTVFLGESQKKLQNTSLRIN